ncbi:MAG: adenylate/guanylate cyclase domain-containing protein [Acidimicrobiales bacterium]
MATASTRQWPSGMTPRVERFFGFVDLCGFSDFNDTYGDEEAAVALHGLRFAIREAASEHGVRVDKWLGDGAMLVAVEPEPLLAACVRAEMVLRGTECRLALRAGAAGGDVMIFEGDDYVGRPVNLAAKLCALAYPGQILVAADMAGSLPADSHDPRREKRSVPGFTDLVELVSFELSAVVS